MQSLRILSALVLAVPLLLVSGCPGGGLGLGGVLNTIRVTVTNNTAFGVDPGIRFSEDDGDFDAFIAGIFGNGEDLETGVLAPNEQARFSFDCDKLGLILSNEPTQFLPFGDTAEGSDSRVLQQGEDFDCGDTIDFEFVGTADDFGIVVTVNGRVVD